MSKAIKTAKAADTMGNDLDFPTSNPMNGVAPVKANSIQTAGPDEPLDTKEQKLLVECENDIQQNQQGFFVVGYRLWQISSQKLHRSTHRRYEDYCAEKFDFSKTHANRLVQAYLCEEHLKTVKAVDVYVPTKESQARVIWGLKPEQQVEVASEVFEMVGDKGATAGDFETAREKLYPKPKPKSPKRE